MNELAQDRFFAHDPGVVLDVRRRGHEADQVGQIRCAADRFDADLAAQRVGQRDQVDGLAGLEHVEHDLEDPAMGILIEIIGRQELDDLVDGIVLDQDGAEHHLFGLDVLGRKLLQRDFGLDGHGSSSKNE